MAPKSRLSTTSTRKWAKCFSGSQSRKEGGKSRSCFKLSERKHLAMAASYSQTILWKATFLILLANFCESISDRLLGKRDTCAIVRHYRGGRLRRRGGGDARISPVISTGYAGSRLYGLTYFA